MNILTSLFLRKDTSYVSELTNKHSSVDLKRLCVTWTLLRSWSMARCCSSHICDFHHLCTADTAMQGHPAGLLRGHSWHWKNVPHLNTQTHGSPALCICVCAFLCLCVYSACFPTLRDVAAHHRHVALVYEIPQRHIPASCSAFTSVAALFSCQVVDVNAGICFLHHSNWIVGSTGSWGNNSSKKNYKLKHKSQFVLWVLWEQCTVWHFGLEIKVDYFSLFEISHTGERGSNLLIQLSERKKISSSAKFRKVSGDRFLWQNSV